MKTVIATVGSIIFDLAVTTPRVPQRGENILGHSLKMGPGGKGANASAAVAKLGASSFLIGSIGDDSFGRMELAALKKAGVNVEGVMIDRDRSTGIAIIMIDDQGENTILVALGANASLTAEAAKTALAPLENKLDALLVNFEIPEPVVSAMIETGKDWGIPVVVDAGPPRSYSSETWKGATVVSPNRLEAEFLVGHPIEGEEQLRQSAAEILNLGPEAVVIKRGSEGALVCTSDELFNIPAFPVKPVDTTGAGDAFTGALTVGLAEGMGLREAVRFGSAAGAITVTRLGTLPVLPTRREVEDFLRSRS